MECSWASRTGLCPPPRAAPHLPRLKQAWVPDVSAGRGRQGVPSAGRDHRCSHPHASPTHGRAPPRPPPLRLAHFGAAEVPVTLKHHGTGWLLEPLLASPSLGCTLSRCLRFALHFGFVTWEVALGPWPGHCSRSLWLYVPRGAGRVNPPSLAGTREVIAVGSGNTELSLLAPGTAVTQASCLQSAVDPHTAHSLRSRQRD